MTKGRENWALILLVKNMSMGTSLVVQWLRLHASTAGDTGSIPGGGTKILHAAQCGKTNKQTKNV